MEQHELKAALEWYLDNGVDEALGDVPADYFAVVATPAPLDTHAKSERQLRSNVTAPTISALGAADARAEAIKLAGAAQTLDQLRDAIASFEGITLKKTASNMVFGEGNPNASIMIIGDVPGTEEDKSGRPFMGQAGFLFDKMLTSIGLNRLNEQNLRSVYVTNIINWRPPGNQPPAPGQIEASIPFVERHIQLVNPKIILFMGAMPAQSLLSRSEGIAKLRKKWHDYAVISLPNSDGSAHIPALATFHPNYLLGMPAQKKMAWMDLLLLKKRIESLE